MFPVWLIDGWIFGRSLSRLWSQSNLSQVNIPETFVPNCSTHWCLFVQCKSSRSNTGADEEEEDDDNDDALTPPVSHQVLILEHADGRGVELQSYVLPNEPINDKVPLESFLVPIETIERASGLLFVPNIMRRTSNLRAITGHRWPPALTKHCGSRCMYQSQRAVTWRRDVSSCLV